MKQIKVSEATPIQLDWLVAKCEGQAVRIEGGNTKAVIYGRNHNEGTSRYHPTGWAQGGPLVEKEKITLDLYVDDGSPERTWLAQIWGDDYVDSEAEGTGTTPLIAICRCYVASKLGDVVEVPEELG